MSDTAPGMTLRAALSAPAPAPRAPRAESGARRGGIGDAGVAIAFEAAFLSEMLKQSGLTKAFGALAGEGGETGFSDLLTRRIAEDIARHRPLGIADRLAARLEPGQ